MFRFFQRHSHISTLFLRLAVSMIFTYHGYLKLFGPNAPMKLVNRYVELGVPLPGLSAYLVGGAEFFCGLLIGLGMLTRWASLILIGTMLFVIFVVFRGETYLHMEQSVQLLILVVGTLFSGSGSFSFENLVKKHGD